MLNIKRLYRYVLQSFVPVFFMTFTITLFIIIMQFLWRYIEDFVGKGLETIVLAEFFFYIALTLVPMAMPLAILLASLMTFGNLGESAELIAIKASGISLLKAMRPLIILVSMISIGTFFFQDNIIPKAQLKMRTLLLSIKDKSPELDIPESTFYSNIENYNLYVKKKNHETGMLYDMMIYDLSKGFDNMAVIVCDSGKIRSSVNKDFLQLTLYNGQDFRNFQQTSLGNTFQTTPRNNKFVPYGRENFKERQVLIPFNSNFNRIDESTMAGDRMSKDITELRSSIDSLNKSVDSINVIDRRIMKHSYLSYRAQDIIENDSLAAVITPHSYDVDSVIRSLSPMQHSNLYSNAVSRAESSKNDLLFRSLAKSDIYKKLRLHEVELQRKFVLSFACIIFFFIGAPLGAIIRKGGLGMPVVISVFLFIIYYIVDNVGYKMARDGVWLVWQGVWFSSFILFPLGVFITYKAINDSALFNPEAYGKYLHKIFFVKTPPKNDEYKREVIMKRIPDISELHLEPEVLKGLEAMDSDKLRDIVENHQKYEYEQSIQMGALSLLKQRGADITNIIDRQDLTNTQTILAYFKSSSQLSIIFFFIGLLFLFFLHNSFANILEISYIFLYIRSIVYYFTFYGKTDNKTLICNIFIAIALFFAYPLLYVFVVKRMNTYLKKIQITLYS